MLKRAGVAKMHRRLPKPERFGKRFSPPPLPFVFPYPMPPSWKQGFGKALPAWAIGVVLSGHKKRSNRSIEFAPSPRIIVIAEEYVSLPINGDQTGQLQSHRRIALPDHAHFGSLSTVAERADSAVPGSEEPASWWRHCANPALKGSTHTVPGHQLWTK
jgi:hypothetical protein